MIICLSIVDKHRPEGSRHVGTVNVEVDIPTEDTCYDIMGWVVPLENEPLARAEGIGCVHSKAEILALGPAVNGLGENVTE